MPIIIYETEEGIFHFHREHVIEALQKLDTHEARELIHFLESQAGDTVEIPRDNRIFPYAILKLLEQGKGTVFCKTCGKEYQAGELVSFPLGAGENPLKVKVGYGESLLNRILRRQKRMPLVGGKGYGCPKGHELIAAVTWRT